MPGISARRFPSPLRYPGGKWKVANFLKLLLLENRLTGREYVEVYAGGASVALTLLFEEYASHIHINDVNESVHAFWWAVLNEGDELCRLIESTPVTMYEWRRQREIQAAPDADPVALAFSTFFLNRTNRSGIIGGGVIGGQDQSGPWKLDARYNSEDLIRRIRKIQRSASRITLTRMDAADYLREWPPGTKSCLAYLDPPYFIKGQRLYPNFYEAHDHAEIAELVGQLDVPWVVSYDLVPEICDLYSPHRSIRYALSYSAADRSAGQEVMFVSDGLSIPTVESPANIRTGVVDKYLRNRSA